MVNSVPLTRLRSIPACAGETFRLSLVVIRIEVYPRVCGGNARPKSNVPSSVGLSPRVRGKPL